MLAQSISECSKAISWEFNHFKTQAQIITRLLPLVGLYMEEFSASKTTGPRTSFLPHIADYTKLAGGAVPDAPCFLQQTSSQKEKLCTQKIEVIFLNLCSKWHSIISNCRNRSISPAQTQGEMIVHRYKYQERWLLKTS